ncbi:MAG: hypothetical protein NTW76_13450 [Corynebacteriales bacterium]|nr:hypothetical protein [Mycobacteriales bacterium]
MANSRRATPAATHDDGPSTAAVPVEPCCWAVVKMLNNAATIAVAGVGGAVGADDCTAACRPPEVEEVTVPVAVAVDGADVVDVAPEDVVARPAGVV